MSNKRLFEKVAIRQEPVTVSDSRKVDLSMMSFQIRLFAVQRFKDLHSKQRQKVNNSRCLKKRYM